MINFKIWKNTRRFFDAGDKNFRLIFFSFVTGIIAGIAGSIFRLVLAYIGEFRDVLYINAENGSFFYRLLPWIFGAITIGISLFLVKRFAPETSGSGVQEIEGALDGIRPLRWKRVIPVKFFASLFSLGSGLLLGREGPTVQIGANIGKMTEDVFKQTPDERNPLVAAGAAAGLASAFNAPLAGIIFVIEEMHGHFRHTFYSVAAIMIASGTADLAVRILIGADPVIKMSVFPAPDVSYIWMFVVLGVLLSFAGYLFNFMIIKILDFFHDISKTYLIISVVFAALLIAVTGIINPKMIGGGYETVRLVLDNSLSLKLLAVLFAGRLLLTVFSYGLGVPGGIFAPLLALGVIFGMFFGTLIHLYFPDFTVSSGVFAVAGMAGIFAATVRAPLTGLVLAVEMTSNYEMILPLIITAVTASVVTAQSGNSPIYTVLLRRTVTESLPAKVRQ
ncbi:MAG: H(+)/Cl(-) exchange transporter ClcA [Chlorobi bacterium]|nr:H(+)/Cl(-) exchange transporter ClcA [Chlorobiota bacterium]